MMHLIRLAIVTMAFWLLTSWSGHAQNLPGVQQPQPKPTPAQTPEDVKAGVMKLTLRKGLELQGSPVDLESVKINGLFGEVNIPLHTIAGIRFAQDPGEQTTVVLLNGDALTGELTLADIKFVSEWGEAKVNVAHISSVVFHPDLSWSAVNTPNGRRWQLTRNPNPPSMNLPARVYTRSQ